MTQQRDRIEPVEEKDYDEIARVWEASVRTTHDFLSESDIGRLAPLVRERYLPSVRLFCVRDEAQRIAAFIGLCKRHIEMLFVRRTVRRTLGGRERTEPSGRRILSAHGLLRRGPQPARFGGHAVPDPASAPARITVPRKKAGMPVSQAFPGEKPRIRRHSPNVRT